MDCKGYNIKVVEGNEFALLLTLKKRTFTASTPIDEDIDPTALDNCVVKVNGVAYTPAIDYQGVTVIMPATLKRTTYNIELTATYQGSAIRAAYFEAFTIVGWNEQSDAQQYIQGSPIVLEPAYVIGGTLTDAQLEQLKQEYREKIAAAEAAKEAADQAKEDFDEKAEALDNVAQQGTNPDANLSSTQTAAQGAALNSQIARGYIGTPQSGQPDTLFGAIANISIDTSTIAKQGTNASATLTATQTAATNAYASAEAAKNGVVDGNDTAIGVAKEIRSEVGTGSDTAAESGTLFAVLKWVKDKVKSIFNLIGSPASGQPATLFAAIAAGGGGGGDAQESTSQAILSDVQDILPSQQAVLQCYAILAEKGVQVPAAIDQTIENLPATIALINKKFVGQAVLSSIPIVDSVDYPSQNFSGILLDSTELRMNGKVYVERMEGFRCTSKLATAFSFNGNAPLYLDISGLDTSNLTTIAYFSNNGKTLDMHGLDLRKVTTCQSAFQNRPLFEWMDMSGTRVSSLLTNTNAFMASGCQICPTMVGDHTLNDVIDNNICIFEGLSVAMNISSAASLNRASLRAWINGLADLSGGTAQTFTIGATNLAKLTADDIAIATNKNWNLT